MSLVLACVLLKFILTFYFVSGAHFRRLFRPTNHIYVARCYTHPRGFHHCSLLHTTLRYIHFDASLRTRLSKPLGVQCH